MKLIPVEIWNILLAQQEFLRMENDRFYLENWISDYSWRKDYFVDGDIVNW